MEGIEVFDSLADPVKALLEESGITLADASADGGDPLDRERRRTCS